MTLGVWQATGAQDLMGKIFGVFFPVLAFVAIGMVPLLPLLTSCQLNSYTGEQTLFGTDCCPHQGQGYMTKSPRWGWESVVWTSGILYEPRCSELSRTTCTAGFAHVIANMFLVSQSQPIGV